MADIVFEISGIKSVKRGLAALISKAYLRLVLRAAAFEMQNEITQYPASTDANKPKSWSPGGKNSWYERGYGTRWVRKDGSEMGRRTSQTLGRSWTTSSGLTWAKVGTRASYARWVQDADVQAGFHKRRGWRTAQDALDRVGDRIIPKIENAIDRAWTQS